VRVPYCPLPGRPSRFPQLPPFTVADQQRPREGDIGSLPPSPIIVEVIRCSGQRRGIPSWEDDRGDAGGGRQPGGASPPTSNLVVDSCQNNHSLHCGSFGNERSTVCQRGRGRNILSGSWHSAHFLKSMGQPIAPPSPMRAAYGLRLSTPQVPRAMSPSSTRSHTNPLNISILSLLDRKYPIRDVSVHTLTSTAMWVDFGMRVPKKYNRSAYIAVHLPIYTKRLSSTHPSYPPPNPVPSPVLSPSSSSSIIISYKHTGTPVYLFSLARFDDGRIFSSIRVNSFVRFNLLRCFGFLPLGGVPPLQSIKWWRINDKIVRINTLKKTTRRNFSNKVLFCNGNNKLVDGIKTLWQQGIGEHYKNSLILQHCYFYGVLPPNTTATWEILHVVHLGLSRLPAPFFAQQVNFYTVYRLTFTLSLSPPLITAISPTGGNLHLQQIMCKFRWCKPYFHADHAG